jgi:hypothetical protein
VRFVQCDYDSENWFSSVAGRQSRVMNPWDSLPSAYMLTYPPELLGFGAKADDRKRFVMAKLGQ